MTANWIIFIAGMGFGGMCAAAGCALAAYNMMNPHQ